VFGVVFVLDLETPPANGEGTVRPVYLPRLATEVEPENDDEPENDSEQTAFRTFGPRGSLFLDTKKILAELHRRLLNRPEGERLALFQTRVPIINQLQSTLMTGAHQRLVFPEFKGVEGASVFWKHDSHDDSMLILLLIDSKNLCWYACHSPSFDL
jgi:hypothetical protein